MVTELLDRSAPPPLPNTIRVRALLQRFYLYYIQKATISTIADPCAQDTSIHFSDLCSYHLIFCTFFPIVSGRTNKLCILKFEDFQDWMNFKVVLMARLASSIHCNSTTFRLGWARRSCWGTHFWMRTLAGASSIGSSHFQIIGTFNSLKASRNIWNI